MGVETRNLFESDVLYASPQRPFRSLAGFEGVTGMVEVPGVGPVVAVVTLEGEIVYAAAQGADLYDEPWAAWHAGEYPYERV
jgi:hypothetical protein